MTNAALAALTADLLDAVGTERLQYAPDEVQAAAALVRVRRWRRVLERLSKEDDEHAKLAEYALLD